MFESELTNFLFHYFIDNVPVIIVLGYILRDYMKKYKYERDLNTLNSEKQFDITLNSITTLKNLSHSIDRVLSAVKNNHTISSALMVNEGEKLKAHLDLQIERLCNIINLVNNQVQQNPPINNENVEDEG